MFGPVAEESDGECNERAKKIGRRSADESYCRRAKMEAFNDRGEEVDEAISAVIAAKHESLQQGQRCLTRTMIHNRLQRSKFGNV